jgi:hypothetical protein
VCVCIAIVAIVAGRFVDAFRIGIRLVDVKATNHPKSVGERSCFPRVPDIIGTGFGHHVAGLPVVGSIVLVYGGVPIQRFVLFDVPLCFR